MESKTQESPWALQEPPIFKNLELKLQTLTNLVMVVTEDYYHVITWDEDVI